MNGREPSRLYAPIEYTPPLTFTLIYYKRLNYRRESRATLGAVEMLSIVAANTTVLLTSVERACLGFASSR